MAPLNYAKWDNIDTDSESESESETDSENILPHQPPTVPSPPPSLQATPLASNNGHDVSDTIKAVIVRCDGDQSRDRLPPFSPYTIPADHPVFSQSVPPIPEIIEVPLVIHRVGTQSPNRADLDNQKITYINAELDLGLAPSAWQSHIGTVIVARKDKKPLLLHHFEGVWMYCDYIMDCFGEGGEVNCPRYLYNRAAFENWWKGYVREQQGFRTGRGGEDDADDWRAVRSPFEM